MKRRARLRTPHLPFGHLLPKGRSGRTRLALHSI
jgi:hypothetical protein